MLSGEKSAVMIDTSRRQRSSGWQRCSAGGLAALIAMLITLLPGFATSMQAVPAGIDPTAPVPRSTVTLAPHRWHPPR
jgi:hypothetical protein